MELEAEGDCSLFHMYLFIVCGRGHMVPRVTVENSFWESLSLFYNMGLQDLNLRHQAWWQASLPSHSLAPVAFLL